MLLLASKSFITFLPSLIFNDSTNQFDSAQRSDHNLIKQE